MKTNIFKIILTGFCLFAAHNSAYACRQDAPVKLEDIKHADTVIIAKIARFLSVVKVVKTKYAIEAGIPDGKPFYLHSYVHVNFELNEVLKGRAPDKSEFIITGSTIGNSVDEIKSLPKNTPYIFALMGKDGTKEWRYDATNPKSELMAVMQAPCSSPYIFEATDAQIMAAKKVLVGVE